MKRKSVVLLLVVGLVLIGIYASQRDNTTVAPKTNSSSTKDSTKQTDQQATDKSFDKAKYSRTSAASIWVIVNKSHSLSPKNYVPNDLVLPNVKQRVPGTEEMKMRAEAARALKRLFSGANSASIKLLVSTAYRSYSYQTVLYDNDVKAHGRAAADQSTARPGYSEHQTGLAVDIRAQSGVCSVQQCFGNTPEGRWLAANAYKYGFLLRYPADKQAITGYEYEPWHFRYIGTELSNELHKQDTKTLEEFFNVSGGGTYR
jgi:D-alanyl-D-alanine carboxypeptidase